MRSILFIVSLAIVFLYSCDSPKHSTVENDTEKNESIIPKLIQKNSINQSFIVSFFSPGNGIDFKIKKEFELFLADNYPELDFETVKWGKEGEIDYCFILSDLTPSEVKEFIEKSKEILLKSKRVHTYEDKPCREHK